MSGLKSSLTRDYDAYGRLSRTSLSDASGYDVVYDDRGEVAAATVAGRSETHAYDFIGNEFASNCLNQPTEDTDCGNVAYDDCGRLITHSVAGSSPTLVLTYDAMHRLETASAVEADITLVQSSVYDNAGRRVMKYAPDGVHRYYYDDWLLRLETISTADGLVTIEYVWGKDISGSIGGAAGIGGLLYAKINGVIYVPQYDAYGNIIGYCDSAGAVVASYAYDAFGRTISQSGALADVFAFRYSTKHFDRETGFYYYGKRYYSPALRRWLTRDPIGENGGLNLYEFCLCGPVFNYDSIGNFAIKVLTHGVLSTWHGDVQVEKEVTTADDIFIDERLSCEVGDVGDFVFPNREMLVFYGCDVELYVYLWLRKNLVQKGNSNTEYYYVPHFKNGNRMDGGSVSTSDGSPQVRDAILAHEKGHATSYLENVIPKLREYVKKFGNKSANNLTAVERKDIKDKYDELCRNAIEDSCARANDAHINWYKSHGYNIIKK